MKSGGTIKKVKKMAMGGSATNKLNAPKAPTKPTRGDSNVKMGIYGIPNSGPTGPNIQGVNTMKKGGMVKKYAEGGKAELGPVYNKPTGGRGGAGTYEPTKTNTTKTTKVMKKGGTMKKMATGGSLKQVPADKVGLSKLPTAVRNKMGYMKKGGSKKR